MKSLRLALVLLLAAVFLAACDDDATGPGDTIEGAYALYSVNGLTLPAAYWTGGYNGAHVNLATAGSLNLAAGGGVNGSLTIEFWTDGEQEGAQTGLFFGSYSLSGQAVTFDFGGDVVTGTWSGNTLALDGDGFGPGIDALTFRR